MGILYMLSHGLLYGYKIIGIKIDGRMKDRFFSEA